MFAENDKVFLKVSSEHELFGLLYLIKHIGFLVEGNSYIIIEQLDENLKTVPGSTLIVMEEDLKGVPEEALKRLVREMKGEE